MILSRPANPYPDEIFGKDSIQKCCYNLSGAVSVVVPRSASASMPSHTSAGLAFVVSRHADTINSCPEWSASVGDLCDYAVGLVNRRNWHRLC